jgi:hypothetical protein
VGNREALAANRVGKIGAEQKADQSSELLNRDV